jgi:pimeloyl-ACP methyl ester carboxylesterase
MRMTDHLMLANGDRLDYILGGDGDALLVYHHGTPAAGPIPQDMSEAASAHGFVIAELVRPGYGESTRQPGRSVADVVPLVEALADHLSFDRFVTMGWSGGGPHAIATAALLPRRCAAAMSLASVGPYDAADLDFLAGMGEDNIAEFGAALDGGAALESFLDEAAGALREVTADQVVDAMRSLLPAVDQAHLTGAEGEEMAAELRWSLAHGIWGWFDDDIAFTRPWGFDLDAIRIPIQVWQGTDDLMVPFAHGRWLAERLPSTEPRLVEGEGHLSLAAQAFTAGFAGLRDALHQR